MEKVMRADNTNSKVYKYAASVNSKNRKRGVEIIRRECNSEFEFRKYLKEMGYTVRFIVNETVECKNS